MRIRMRREELLQMIDKMSPEQQKEIFVKYIEKCTEEEKNFLEQIILSVYTISSEKRIEKNTPKLSKEYVEEKMEQIRDWKEKIDGQELYLRAEAYEDYCYDYWEREMEWEYYDEMDVGSKLAEMVDFANDCINYQYYKEALEIFDYLLGIEVTVEDEYGDGTATIDLEELAEDRIFSPDLQKMALQTLYATYQVHKAENRAKELFYYFQYHIFQKIHMEDMLKVGREELQELNIFWENWIQFLEEEKGDLAGRLLKEAVIYYKGVEGLEEASIRNYNSHPSLALATLYEYANSYNYKKMEKIGIEALKNIDTSLKIRSEIALMTAFSAEYLQHTKNEYICYFEAFRSQTSVRNLLRLYANEELAITYKDKIKKIVLNIQPKKEDFFSTNRSRELALNTVDSFLYNELCFYIGYFGYARKQIQNPEGSLGWSGKFIRRGLTLFLVYLYDKDTPTKAIDTLVDNISFGEVEDNGFLPQFEKDIVSQQKRNHTFWHSFQCWKKYHPMEQVRKEKYYLWAKNIVYSRAEAIVGGQFRRHYEEVAILLAALGDIKESWGDFEEKNKIRFTHKKKFPRHSAFQSAIARYF